MHDASGFKLQLHTVGQEWKSVSSDEPRLRSRILFHLFKRVLGSAPLTQVLLGLESLSHQPVLVTVSLVSGH